MGALNKITSIKILDNKKLIKYLKKKKFTHWREKWAQFWETIWKILFSLKKIEIFDFTTILKTYIIWVYTYIKRNEKYVLFDMWSKGKMRKKKKKKKKNSGRK